MRWIVAVCIAMGLLQPVAALAQGNIGKGRAEDVTHRVAPLVSARLASVGFRLGAPLFVRIFKQERKLEIWLERKDGRFALFRTYPICDFSGDLGPKVKEGDEQSPEGFYFVTPASLNRGASSIFPSI